MRIGVLNEPSNFHTRKWAENIQKAGAEVVILSFESPEDIPGVCCVQLKPVLSKNGKSNALSYLLSGNTLKKALAEYQIDIIFAINVTPFGIWAMQSGFHPFISFAIGADILEFPPLKEHPEYLIHRSWNDQELKNSRVKKTARYFRHFYYRYMVSKVLNASDLILADNKVLTDAIEEWFSVSPDKIRLNRGGVEENLFEVGEEKIRGAKKYFRIPEKRKVVLIPRGLKLLYQTDIILQSVLLFLESGREDAYFIILSSSYETPTVVLQLINLLKKKYPQHIFIQENLLPREEMYPLWKLTDIFISAPVYDGYSAVVAEGRYAGAIPIVNDTPATREILTHQKNAWIVHPFTPEKLCTSLAFLCDNLDEYKNRFAAINTQWINENSLMKASIKNFMEECRILVEKNKRSV